MASARVIRLSQPDPALEEEARVAARIAQEVRRGDEGAKSELYERYGPGLLRLALRKVKDRDSAEGIVQETFSIALAKLSDEDLEYPERLAGYLMGIVRHRVSAHFRNVNRQPTVAEPGVVDSIRDVRPLQYEDVAEEQTKAVVRELLESLPVERDREILIRIYLHDQDRSEVREALNLSPHQLDVALSRARARFKKIVVESEFSNDLLPR